jgi:hypothetical protein
MKWSLKPGKTVRSVSLVLQPLHNLLDALPIPGAKDGIGLLLNAVEGIDVSITLPKFRNYRPSLFTVPFQTTSRNNLTLLELGDHLQLLTNLLKPLTKMDRKNISFGLKKEVQRLSE